MKVKPIKIKIKQPTPTAADRLYAKHQAIRKASGLPDPSEYKKKLEGMKEETELNEISAELKASYKSKAQTQVKETQPWTKKGEYKDLAKNIIAKRKKGIAKVSEETEQLDEISRDTLLSYANKVSLDSQKHSKDPTRRSAEKANRSVAGYAKAHNRLEKPVKEETEQLDEMPESSMKTRDVHSHLKKAGWAIARTGGGHDIYSHPQAKRIIAVPRHKQLKAPLIKGIIKASKVSEETEIDEQLEKKGRFVSGPPKKTFKAPTIVSPIKEAKDTREYDYEGDMATSQLRSLIFNAEDLIDMMDDNINLPEWVQSKITLAEDYISTAANYLRGELSEEVKPPTGDLKDACWKGYTAVGMKMKNGRKVPNCVPVKEETDEPSMAARTLSRKAQIVKMAAKSKKEEKEEASDKFQKDPELSSDIQKT